MTVKKERKCKWQAQLKRGWPLTIPITLEEAVFLANDSPCWILPIDETKPRFRAVWIDES